jgi:hypothetical protein
MQRWSIALLALVLAFLGGCGGGGGGNSGTPPAVPTPPSQPTPANAVPLIVDGGPANIADIPFVTVTICAPGSSTNCQTVDHIQVDTGSSGLRIMSSVLSPALSLPQLTDPAGNPVVACAQFVDGFSWGPVKTADLKLGGETASSLSVQVIGDPAFASIPSSCSSSGPPENTVATFGANGLLGVGPFLQDCGTLCARLAIAGTYYICPTSGCRPTQVPVTQQLQNPAAMFAVNNNGVLIQMPAIPAAGAATATGSLIFGIGTQPNNGLGAATVLAADPGTGNITTVFNGVSYANSFIDSGSSVTFFGSGLYPTCRGAAAGLYCPAAAQALSATLYGSNQAASTVTFSVANADALLASNPTFTAFSNLAAPYPNGAGFAWGLPFFFGRSVFTAFEGRSTPGGVGPYVAF